MVGRTLQINGQGVSSGIAIGKVKIIRDEKDFDESLLGQIAVTRRVIMKWWLPLSKATAIVAEMGGITSHAAILAREIGIPCVVGARDAVANLKDGWVISVDGGKGNIKIIKK